MCPLRIDPNTDYRKLRELASEFSQTWRRLQAFYLDAAIGFQFVREYVEADQAKLRQLFGEDEPDLEELLEGRSFSYAEILSEDFCTARIHEATLGEVRDRNENNGANFTTLGQVCLVSFYDFWNDYLRREYVIAKGQLAREEQNKEIINAQLKEYASHDLWGDIRRLRISVVHNKGVAIEDIVRNRLIRWFEPGAPISIAPPHMRAIFLALLGYRNELFSEQFPERYITIPTA